jgi:transposase InsO family protein
MEVIAHTDRASINELCRILDVSRSAYYAWRRAEPTTREARDSELLPLVRTLFGKHRRRYGARRIAEELHDLGQACGRHRVSKLLRTQGLRAIQPKSFKPRTTESRHRLGYSPNLLLESEEPTAVNQLWVGDITYVPLAGGLFSYLATLMDRVSRRVVGWALGDDMTESLVLAALTMAIRTRSPQPQLIHHTDRGGQYAGSEYRAVLRRAEMRQSMSRAGDCYDNAFMESCFGTIKTELEMTEYQNHGEALSEIRQYLAYYNIERKHSALGYLTPHQFEDLNQPPN